jgi:hypothetical protein
LELRDGISSAEILGTGRGKRSLCLARLGEAVDP